MLYKKELLENNKSLVEENKLLKKRLEQKENVIREAKESCISVIGNPEWTIVSKNELCRQFLQILSKGD